LDYEERTDPHLVKICPVDRRFSYTYKLRGFSDLPLQPKFFTCHCHHQ